MMEVKSKKLDEREDKYSRIIIPNEQAKNKIKKSENNNENQKEERDKKIKRLNALKREIDIEVRLNKTPSKEKSQKIREYIDLCNEIYQNEEISFSEIEFLKKAMYKIPIEGKDLARFVKRCCDVERYGEALKLVMNRTDLNINSTEKEEESFKNIQSHLLRIYRIQEATRLNKKRK